MPDPKNDDQDGISRPTSEQLYKILTCVGQSLGVPVERADVQADNGDSVDPLGGLLATAAHVGIAISEVDPQSAIELIGFVREGFQVILATDGPRFIVLQSMTGQQVEALEIAVSMTPRVLTRGEIGKLVRGTQSPRCLVCKNELECDAISSVARKNVPHDDDDGHHHEHIPPFRRWIGLLSYDKRDISAVFLFAFVAGVLMLATPLAVESLVNVVSWGTYLQPLLILGLMLLVCLGIAGVLRVLQTVVVELIQRRQFVRIVGDLAHRFPRADRTSLKSEYPRELANRVFDIMTIQKATATLLLDGVSIILTTVIGLVLLAFYHPFLLGFDIVLFIAMVTVTWVLGRGGVRTAIKESITKYRVAHWLQDVIAMPSVFKTGGGEKLAAQRANQLTADYIQARQDQFRVILRQVIFAIGLQAIASTALLALGGWLVIDRQLTLGQLVASELVVTTVVGAFAKAGKSLEKLYDLLAGIDKVGHLIDVPTDERHELGELPDGPAEVSWRELTFNTLTSSSKIPPLTIQPGSRVAIVGDDINGRKMLVQTFAGLVAPSSGIAQIAGYDCSHISANANGRFVGYAGRNDIFHGTLRENVDLGRTGFGQHTVRAVLLQVGLGDVISQLPDGLYSRLQTDGFPLTEIQAKKVTLARAMLSAPRLLIVDGLLDDFSAKDRELIWKNISAPENPWTLVVNTNHDDVAKLCDTQITVRQST